MNFCCIIGIAPCLEEDLENLFQIANKDQFDFIGVGLDSSDRVNFDLKHMATYHPEDIAEFEQRRKRFKGNLDYIVHSHQMAPGVHKLWPLVAKHPLSGSSAFLACQVAVGLEYDKIVLCGCPMSGKNLNAPSKSGYDVFQKGWEKHAFMLEDRVRSMSGFTKELLGEPTKSWLEI
jgi:hypothetical protein